MGTGIFVNAKRGRTLQQAEMESLTDEELQDLLRRAKPAQASRLVRCACPMGSQAAGARECRTPGRETTGCG